MIQHAIDHALPVARAKRLRHEIPPGALFALADGVRAWHQDFVDHVRYQEGRCGFLAFLAEAAPRYRDHVDRLRVDHRHLASALGALRLKILRVDDVSHWDALVAEADAIEDAIAEHVALEDEMLLDGLENP